MIEKVISGGQTGADIAGLKAAKACGIPTGGFIPLGYKTQEGPKPEYEALYNLIELDTASYRERTRLNVMQSDCTIRFAYDYSTPGERCTLDAIRDYAKPYVDIGTDRLNDTFGVLLSTQKELVTWLLENEFKIINIAGNSKKRYDAIEDLVYEFLMRIFTDIQDPIPVKAAGYND
jgi:hypothetical protein